MNVNSGYEKQPLLQNPPPVNPAFSTPVEGDTPSGPQPQGLPLPGAFVVPCRVCARPLHYNPNPKVSVLKCPQCQEGTQVGPPPQGKQYVVCGGCNALLSVNNGVRAVRCNRPACQRTTILAPPEQGKTRAFCGHCSTLLSFKRHAAVVICAKCHHRSVINHSKMVGYTLTLFLLGLLLLGIGVGVFLWSYLLQENGPTGGFYIFLICPMVSGFILLVRATFYSILNCSARPAQHVGV